MTILVDEATAQRWYFTGGYDASIRLVTEVDCEHLATWMGERGEYAGTLLEALGESECPKGGAHEWGIDGAHSNEYCKKCFRDKP